MHTDRRDRSPAIMQWMMVMVVSSVVELFFIPTMPVAFAPYFVATKSKASVITNNLVTDLVFLPAIHELIAFNTTTGVSLWNYTIDYYSTSLMAPPVMVDNTVYLYNSGLQSFDW